MVTADNMNLDVLEMIFAYLSCRDLASVALVSRSFLAGVIPRLYSKLLFRLAYGKKYPRVMTPFATILSHPDLAVHVREVALFPDIRYLPKSSTTQPHPEFIRDCTSALTLCNNLTSFTYSGVHLPPFLSSLQNKPRLQHLRVNANLTIDQTAKLAEMNSLRTLILHHASWCVVDMLPKWIGLNKTTLTNLTLWKVAALNECILELVLTQTPQLRGLHIIECSPVGHATILKLAKHILRLESLSLTAWSTSEPLTTPPSSLSHLRHLAFDMRCSYMQSPAPSPICAVLAYIRPSFPSLSSVTLKFSEAAPVTDLFLQELLRNHGNTLRKLTFINCFVSTDNIKYICETCSMLQKLELCIPVKDIEPFGYALSHSMTLRTVVDTKDSHTTHGLYPTLTQGNVRSIMEEVGSLKRIVSDNKVWTVSRHSEYDLDISLERRNQLVLNPWFTPCD